ncbi:hypothetical protein CSUI_003433 [Cystoisospora suis]|uniref:Uncharacterized protein n=1 Tax=Cystoisospora suis TaxID=483139 RepID=A0A2C6L4C5_9APIC|nr:hypothetical protein CSUI_003433 [Cystoisospora suis]
MHRRTRRKDMAFKRKKKETSLCCLTTEVKEINVHACLAMMMSISFPYLSREATLRTSNKKRTKLSLRGQEETSLALSVCLSPRIGPPPPP